MGIWIWKNSYTGKETASLGYEVDTRDGRPWVRLFYRVTPWNGTPADYDYKILLTQTRPNFGGRRWWFVCPLNENGRGCSRRCGKLYLPPGGRYYGCRQCYRLTYESAQEHDPRVSRLANDPLALYAAMSGAIDDAGNDTQRSIPNLLVVLKAWDQVDRREQHSGRR